MPAVSEKQRRAMYAAAEGHSNLGIPKKVGEEFVGARKDAAARGDCAGILFRVANGPLFLLLQRADTGEWCIPGGHIEGDETPEEAAERECQEEIGVCPDGLRWAARKNSIPSGKGLFTCFLQNVSTPFEVELNEEHTNWGWFTPDALPQPMHRKVAETIERVSGTELDVAKRIASGELLSPQRYENMWLFDLRITGTGTSYRKALDEYVYRPPEEFLTEEFRQRCNGLPVIFIHPEKSATLNSKEYRERSIGSVLLPYIKGDEVRGVAKVFDDDAAVLMCTTHVSTSPAVIFRDAGSTETVELDDGSTVLIEGKPSYLDHIAICEAGVWDKGGEPTGVNLNGESAVEENEEKVPAWADALIKRCDEFKTRLDAMENKGEVSDEEKAKKAAEEERRKEEEAKRASEEAARAGRTEESEEDKAIREAKERKDAEEKARLDSMTEEERKKEEEHKREEKERADAQARADSQSRENADLRKQIAAMSNTIAGLTRPLSAEDRDLLSRAQMRADSVAHMFGDSVNPPLHGESPIAYRKRLAAGFQKHSASVKGVKLDSLDDASFGVIEDRIYADAQSAARSPAQQPQGRLMAVTDHSSGRPITTYTGDPNAWMQHFKAPGYIGRINRDAKGVN